LRLAIGREGIGLELARPARLGCLTVTILAATLPGVRFPIDVSGGVPRFRHRRGELQVLEVELGARALERWAAPRLRGIVGTRAPEVWVGVRRGAATVCVASTQDADEDVDRAAPVVAFELQALAEGDDLLLVVERARGTDLPAPATALAIACVEALLGGMSERHGATFVVRQGAGAIARALLPEAGARVPAVDQVPWTSIAAQGDTWILHGLRGSLGATSSDEALRARETAAMLTEGDDALVRGEHLEARTLYVDALERAPRHAEIVRRIVEIDARAGGRAEAALAMLAEARSEQTGTDAHFGATPGELLVETGDLEAALASLERAGETEPAPVLAARAYELAASVARDPQDAATWLDRAVARAPRSATARWIRVTKRLALGRLEDALADVEHLEALARGSRARHLVWLRAGRAWHSAGLGPRAGALFERALRYAPDEPRALLGLGIALVVDGREARGVSVLTRALDIAEARGEPTARILLELARALAERLADFPAAIARASSIPADAFEAPVARGLEGRWRARLGDLAGSALAFARLRELASTLPASSDDPRAQPIAALLLEAAEIERSRLHDPLAAQRHLAVALRLRPRDPDLLRSYREVGALLAQGLREDAPEPRDVAVFPEMEEASATHRTTISDRPALDLSLPSDAEAEASARVDELTRRLHADPRDDSIADELASLLESLGRGHELLALLVARLEDAAPERRVELGARARAALERLAVEADAAGRHDEAALYRGAISTLPG
jgi:tetratricopeptide (TPR) repeat protein